MDLRTDATKAAFFSCHHIVQQRLREMQDAWMIRKAEEIQGLLLLSSDGPTFLRQISQILKRWAERFRSVLNGSLAISDADIDRLAQVDTNSGLDLPAGTAPKIRLRRHRRTTDMIFAARQLQEKCQQMQTHLYTTFADITKAFDTVHRDELWKVMQKFGCPERFTHMVRQLHDGMMARVTDTGKVSEAFVVTNGVKQGCVLAPTLFDLMFSAMLMDAYHDE
ncbi:unnamed protein product [Schistocephalus solidus]|uniref:Reverse transcriptase domain-containing protein n=1 Tax=Schistocephalus solidus TaxID=70667 RepID=A0A183SAX6_SCHSO|nr:unnamed protein product [Schistocephalus solidus]